MSMPNLISEQALGQFLADSDTPAVRHWVLAALGAIRERYPYCDFYVLNRTKSRGIYIGVGRRRPGTASGKNALILIAKNQKAYLALQHNGGFAEQYLSQLSPAELVSDQNPDVADVRNWLEQLDALLRDQDRQVFQGEGRTLDDYLKSLSGSSEDAKPVNTTMVTKTAPLNQILFGPPGTGKTYASIDAALKILDPAFWAEHQTDRAALKNKFDEQVQAKRIRFVTFHQSFSYEDFVEGLRASTDGEHLSYRVESGVFKQVCEQARYVSGALTEDDVIESFLANISKKPMMLSTVRGKAFEVSYKAGNTTVNCVPQASAAELALPANIEHIRSMMRGAEPSNLYCASYVKAIAQYLRAQLAEQVSGAANTTQPYVLIIDEINRGNISRIFGELITLIEPSKRAGATEALTVTLPYSKEPFSVPDNVYLIGTMNTADRSLAGLDIALRRRFEFVEMPPKPKLLKDVWVEGVNIGELLGVMNQRIEVLLGRDYQLGHAYFMPLKGDPTLARLKSIIRNQVLPLLQEYFFEDWQRIAWVLNDHRKPEADQFVQLKESRLNELFGNEVSVPNNGEVWQINAEAFGRISAYSGVIAAVNAKEPEATPVEPEA